ncbi:MAG: hypothetical protein GY705_07315 [Bacteroidetes bacterium]|nr:hypothetical protein [Bacteroidota bacterium]
MAKIDYCGNFSLPGKIVIKATGFENFIVDRKYIHRDEHSHTIWFHYNFDRTWTYPGQKKITVHLDADNQIEESKEFNNTGMFIVDVHE